ncbi:MAG: hypothetical protein JSS76_08320 [Bacteroidetes bacterium]|nr:hypothetical protein [Bacteroidota bacterium]
MVHDPRPFQHYADVKNRLWLVIGLYGMHEYLESDFKDKVTIQLVRHYNDDEKPERQTMDIAELRAYLTKGTFTECVPVIPKDK